MDLHQYLEIENRIKSLDNICILKNVPLWRILRRDFRVHYLKSIPKTIKKNISIKNIAINCCKSFISYIRIVISQSKVDNLIFPHPRLFLVNGEYIERLSDPLIDYTDIQKSFLIIERNQNGIHKTPRKHIENVVYSDFIDGLAIIFKYLFYPIYKIKYNKKIEELYSTLSSSFYINKKSFMKQACMNLSLYLLSYHLYSSILSILSPKRVFVAPRETYNFIVTICKKKGIKTYELQHGITYGESELYSGSYSPAIDTDYFLAFGQSSITKNFGMPLNRLINIGFAYKQYVQDLAGVIPSKNKVLLISEPHISLMIIDIALLFSKECPNYKFDIRCHPQECITDKDKKRLKDTNVSIVDNTIESFLAISEYGFVIGENSSSVFEAAALDKKVGRLNFNGFHSIMYGDYDVGTLINSVSDFIIFLSSPKKNNHNINNIYSDFKSEIVNSL